MHVPVAEPADALGQVAAGLVFGIDDDGDVDLGEGVGDEALQVLGEGIVGAAKGGLIPLRLLVNIFFCLFGREYVSLAQYLEAVDEAQQERLPHGEADGDDGSRT